MSNKKYREDFLNEGGVVHDMNTSLKYEQSKFEKQDEFYKKMGVVKINRFNYDNSNIERELQRKDIDLEITTVNDKIYTVSEKNRTSNFGDVLLEIYSVYEQKKLGWAITGESDIFMYFVDSKYNPYVGEFSTKDIHNMIKKNNIMSQITDKNWNDLYKINKNTLDKVINFGDIGDVKCVLTKAYNKNYVTMSVCVPYTVIDKIGVSYKLFDWNGKKINKNEITWKK